MTATENLKFLRNQGRGLVIAIEKKWLVSARQGKELSVESVDLPTGSQVLHPRRFSSASVLRTADKNDGVGRYAAYDPQKKRTKTALGFFKELHRLR